MFDNTVIQPLVDRLGWSENESTKFSQMLSDENKVSESGLFLNNFHGFVTVENVYYAHPEKNLDSALLNNFLMEMRKSVVVEMLTDVFVTDENAENTDYSGVISEQAGTGLFDNAIGYCHAIKVLEMIVTSVQSNRNQRFNMDNFEMLKSEVSGYFGKDGKIATIGLHGRCSSSRNAIREKFHGERYGVEIEDITNCW